MHVEKHGRHWIGQPVAGQRGQVPVSTDRGAWQRTLQGKAPRWGVSELGSHSSFDLDLEQLSPDHHLPPLRWEAGPGGVSTALSTVAFGCSVSVGWVRKERLPQRRVT